MDYLTYKNLLKKDVSYVVHSDKNLGTIKLIKSKLRFFLNKND